MITVALASAPGRERFDGPLDLLLALVRRGGYPMDRLPVAAITGEYNRYVKEAGDADVELGGEYLEVASWLVLLKSRALLPPAPGDGADPPPEQELARALLDHAQVRKTAALLRERLDASGLPAAGSERLTPDVPGEDEVAPALPTISPAPRTVGDVLAAAWRALEAAQAHGRAAALVPADPYPVEQVLARLETRLRELPPGRAVSTAPWFRELPDPEARAALLVALLELAREGRLLLHQPVPGGPIRCKPLAGAGRSAECLSFGGNALVLDNSIDSSRRS